MKSFTRFAWVTALAVMTSFAACNKDDDNNNNNNDNIVKKDGIVLSGAQEVPAKQTSATGSVNVSYNKTTKVMNFTLSWTNLSDVPTGAHIHGTAAKGANAGIKYDFFSSIPMTVSGTYAGTVTVDNSTIKEDSLLAGFYYFNMHTSNNPGGEIRGQIEF